MTWRAWGVRTQLYAVLNAAVGSMPAGTVVYDGPRARGATPKQFIAVGVAGASLTDDLSVGDDGVIASQQWSPTGPGGWKDETGSVACTVVAWTGETNTAGCRATVAALIATCEAAVAANPTLNGALTKDDHLELVDVRVSEIQTKNGPAVGAVLTWSYTSLVTT